MKRIEYALDNMEVRYKYYKNEDETWYGEIEFWTDTAGQDVATEFDFDGTAEDFVEKFTEHAELYDEWEEMEIFLPMRGQNGIPSDAKTLYEDMCEAKETLMNISGELRYALDGYEHYEINILDKDENYIDMIESFDTYEDAKEFVGESEGQFDLEDGEHIVITRVLFDKLGYVLMEEKVEEE